MKALPYPLLCAVVGLLFGWLPSWVHGPIPGKYTLFHLDGPIVVWGFYVARLTIGAAVGLTVWPRAWFLRGPLCGAVGMLPVGLVALATPGCGPRCMTLNLATGAGVGLLVGGVAFLLTGRSRPD